MQKRNAPPGSPRPWPALLVAAAAALAALPAATVDGRPARAERLRIGTSGSLTAGTKEKEKGALETLRGFIKTETGMNAEIGREKSWGALADKLARKELEVGVFQGYEFAWAQERDPGLKPLALAVNVYRYPVAYVVTQRDNKASDFAGLQGQSLSVAAPDERFLRLFVEREAQAAGKKLESFFAKVTDASDFEDAVDDVVDGNVSATVIDRAALEAYKRSKPGRFAKLKPVAHSQPFPPPLVAYYDKALDDATLKRFRDGLINAGRKEEGQQMLTLFRLTGFDPVPDDFAKVLAETRKAYPLPDGEGK
jgi:ABC-type phosphate/phosphonate transport system substrate-binding protein